LKSLKKVAPSNRLSRCFSSDLFSIWLQELMLFTTHFVLYQFEFSVDLETPVPQMAKFIWTKVEKIKLTGINVHWNGQHLLVSMLPCLKCIILVHDMVTICHGWMSFQGPKCWPPAPYPLKVVSSILLLLSKDSQCDWCFSTSYSECWNSKVRPVDALIWPVRLQVKNVAHITEHWPICCETLKM